MQHTALLIPHDLADGMKPVAVADDIASLYPIIGTLMVTRITPRLFEGGLYCDEDILAHHNTPPLNLRATVLAGVQVYGTVVYIREREDASFTSWTEENPLPFVPCVLQGFSEGVAKSEAGRKMIEMAEQGAM